MTPVDTIQNLYQNYAFINDPTLPRRGKRSAVEAKPVDRADTLMATFLSRTYEKPVRYFFIVYCPLNKPYIKDPDFYKVKGMDRCRKMFKKPKSFFMTREILDCEKVHINAIVATEEDLMIYNKKIYCNKYYVDVRELCSRHHINTVGAYIIKEEKKRPFIKYLDYLHSK